MSIRGGWPEEAGEDAGAWRVARRVVLAGRPAALASEVQDSENRRDLAGRRGWVLPGDGLFLPGDGLFLPGDGAPFGGRLRLRRAMDRGMLRGVVMVSKASGGAMSGERVAFTGRLASMTRDELRALLEEAGASYHESVGDETTVLVIGQEGWPLRGDGRLTKDLEEAQRRQAAGDTIQILREDEFLSEVGHAAADGARRHYTIEQLSRILGVPQSEIRAWIRKGVIRPVRSVRRYCTFDFAEVASARVLVSLRKSGVSVTQIHHSLRRLGQLLPEAEGSLAQLGMIEDGGRVVVELEDGRMIEPGGQLQLDFQPRTEDSEAATPSAAQSPSKAAPRLPGMAENWLEVAVRHDEAGEYEDSAKAYHRALLEGASLEGEARAETCFNLGNVLYALARTDGAAQRYMQAVELDPDYVEAWNNLGNVLCELGDWDAAVEAYGRALALEPDYPDAHFNFGECLHQIGDLKRARDHWKAYLRLDQDSAWARRVRDLLLQTEGGSAQS